VDIIIGGQVAQIPDFRPRLKEITAPVMVLAAAAGGPVSPG
jgi:proline iminopeptidase